MISSKKRVELVLEHEEPDRVPIGEIEINSKPASKIIGREAYVGVCGKYFLKKRSEMLISGKIGEYIERTAKDTIELCSQLGIDFYRVLPNNYKDSIIPEKVAENMWRYSDTELNYWEEIAYNPKSNTWSIMNDSIIARNGISEFEKYVKRLEKATELSMGFAFSHTPISKGIDDREFNVLKTVISNEKGKDLFIVGNARIPFPVFQKWFTVFLEAMLTKPNLVKRYCNILIEVTLKYIEKQLALGACGIVDGMDFAYGKGLMISPKCFKKFILPYLKILSDKCHEYNKPYLKHTDGNIMQVEKEFLINSGIDGYLAIEPRAGMDIFYLKKKYGKKITLIGNVDCSDLLIHGSKEKIESTVKELIKKCKKGGGYILSSSNTIHDDVSSDNYKFMIKTGKKYGVY